MNVSDLDGNISSWHLTGCSAHAKLQNKSQIHLRARSLLNTIYPTLQILEEVPITVRRGETLYLDFYIPLIKSCIEVHGEQHYKFIGHYHNNKYNFMKSKKRDRDKAEWCRINRIDHLVLPFDKSDDEWRNIINGN
jgi:hypothetical protein